MSYVNTKKTIKITIKMLDGYSRELRFEAVKHIKIGDIKDKLKLPEKGESLKVADGQEQNVIYLLYKAGPSNECNDDLDDDTIINENTELFLIKTPGIIINIPNHDNGEENLISSEILEKKISSAMKPDETIYINSHNIYQYINAIRAVENTAHHEKVECRYKPNNNRLLKILYDRAMAPIIPNKNTNIIHSSITIDTLILYLQKTAQQEELFSSDFFSPLYYCLKVILNKNRNIDGVELLKTTKRMHLAEETDSIVSLQYHTWYNIFITIIITATMGPIKPEGLFCLCAPFYPPVYHTPYHRNTYVADITPRCFPKENFTSSYQLSSECSPPFFSIHPEAILFQELIITTVLAVTISFVLNNAGVISFMDIAKYTTATMALRRLYGVVKIIIRVLISLLRPCHNLLATPEQLKNIINLILKHHDTLREIENVEGIKQAAIAIEENEIEIGTSLFASNPELGTEQIEPLLGSTALT